MPQLNKDIERRLAWIAFCIAVVIGLLSWGK
jgi:hypothetical protein